MRKNENVQINQIIEKRGDIIADPSEIQDITSYYNQLDT